MPKNKPSLMWKLSGVALLISLSGCAAGYHDYSDCCIPYLYCTPQPLPYVSYEGGHCPTPGASVYFPQHDTSDTSGPASDVPIESPTPE